MELHSITGTSRAMLATLAVALAVAACNGSQAPTVPVVVTSAPGTSPSSDVGSTDPAIAFPQYAAGLRAHGVQVADPHIDAQGQPVWSDPTAVKFVSDAVDKACLQLLANLPGTVDRFGQQQQGRPDQATLLRFSQCMRDHGIAHFPDPDAGGQIDIAQLGLAKNDPTLAAAQQACQSVFGGAPSPSESSSQ